MGASVYDIPHDVSPAVQFVCVSTAPLTGPQFIFPSGRQVLTPSRQLRNGVLYVIRRFFFSADISALEWQGGWVVPPTLQMYNSGNGNAPIFREPLQLASYAENTEFIEKFYVRAEPADLTFEFNATINASPALAGKTAIRAVFGLIAYEVADDRYIKAFLGGY